MDDLAAGADVVVVAVNDDQARVVAHAVLVVVQAAVLRIDAVFHLRRGRRIGRRGRIARRRGRGICRRSGRGRRGRRRGGAVQNQLAVIGEGVARRRQQAVGLADPVIRALNHVVLGGEVVIITVNLHKAGIRHHEAVLGQIGLAVDVDIQAVGILLPDAVVVKQVEADGVVAGFAHLFDVLDAGVQVAAANGEILVAVHLKPAGGIPLASPAIAPRAGGNLHEFAANQLVVLELVGVAVDLLRARHGDAGLGREVVDAAVDLVPAGLFLAGDGIVQTIVLLQQTGVFAQQHAAVRKLVVELLVALRRGNLLDAGHADVVHIVELRSVLGGDPALIVRGVDDEAVGKRGVGGAEHGALIIFEICSIVIGVQTVLLAKRAAREGVRLRAADAGLVGDLAGVDDGETVVGIPIGVVLHGGLQAGDDAQRVRRGGIDGAIDLDPVRRERERGGLVIKMLVRELKILAVDLHVGDIKLQTRIHMHLDRNGGLGAHALRQRQQQLPRAKLGGVHAEERSDDRQGLRNVLRDAEIVHIQREGVVHILRDARLDQIIDVQRAVFVAGLFRVRNNAVPGKLAVAGGGVIEVEHGLVLAVEVHGRAGIDALVADQRNADIRGAHAAILAGCREHTGRNGARSGIHQTVHQKLRGEIQRHAVPVGIADDRQLLRLAVDRGDLLRVEGEGVRNDNMQRNRAEHRLAGDHVHQNVAKLGAGREHAARNTAGFGVAHHKLRVLRQLGGAARGIDADHRDGCAGAGHEIFILNLNGRVIQRIRIGRGGDHHQRGGDAALIAVRGAVDDAEAVLALRLGDERRGAAAVQIHGLNTAEGEHGRRHLLGGCAAGPGLLTAVDGHDNHLALSRDADAGARGAAAVIVRGGADLRLAVVHEQCAAAECLLDIVAVIGPIPIGVDDGGAVL